MLSRFPLQSNRCHELAQRMLRLALEVDPQAHVLRIRPSDPEALYVVPREGPRGWGFHDTTAVDLHCVDALTGAAGTKRDRYLDCHWLYADHLRIDIVLGNIDFGGENR